MYCSRPFNKSGWWFQPSEKYESQLGWLFPIYGKITNDPNHQPKYSYVPWPKVGQMAHIGKLSSIHCKGIHMGTPTRNPCSPKSHHQGTPQSSPRTLAASAPAEAWAGRESTQRSDSWTMFIISGNLRYAMENQHLEISLVGKSYIYIYTSTRFYSELVKFPVGDICIYW